VKTFLNSNHCRARAHCETCRDKTGGKEWRRELKKTFQDIKKIDFACPAGFPWGKREKPKVKTTFFYLRFEEIVKRHKNNKWLLAMAAQCKKMYENPPANLTCRDKKQFKNRWYKKLNYYEQQSLSMEF